MKLKMLAAAALVAVSSLSAHATTYSLGTLTATTTGQTTFSFGGVINDDYTFTLATDSWLTSSAFAAVGGSAISPAFYGVYNLNGTPVSPTAYTFTTAATSHKELLAAGTYKFSFLGVASGPTAYTVTASAVTAVPEPETYAMLAAGLGIIGFLSSRRRNR
ncbi:FxDxF family PEP-CTERM protein [Pelomonas cellulosilytica]|uniref:FxDxF family PEP-CTERM protein n=1 Tax=Pelomonas cellulosilytica TaxID=2906762 RepID=A0ABS8Y1W5_9BURK|nr:FxDxF family PEP-CTERM protein [Pelomonas sp. P8]MCE4557635.1 FxDxF family PEP-CTERM protein [Pelomonas sp. P8]